MEEYTVKFSFEADATIEAENEEDIKDAHDACNNTSTKELGTTKPKSFKDIPKEQVATIAHILEKYRFTAFDKTTANALYEELQVALEDELVAPIDVESSTQFHNQLVELYRVIDTTQEEL